jgi:hypothetical protein
MGCGTARYPATEKSAQKQTQNPVLTPKNGLKNRLKIAGMPVQKVYHVYCEVLKRNSGVETLSPLGIQPLKVQFQKCPIAETPISRRSWYWPGHTAILQG